MTNFIYLKNVPHRGRFKLYHFFVLLIITIIWFQVRIILNNEYKIIRVFHHSEVPGREGFLVWSNKCKKPNINPYAPDILKFLERKKPLECILDGSVTRVDFNSSIRKYILSVDEGKIKKTNMTCSYYAIQQRHSFVRLKKYIDFKDKVVLSDDDESISVLCNDSTGHFADVYALMPERKGLRQRLNRWKRVDTRRPINVIMLGLDSVSRSNLIRSMPRTAQYLYDNDWFEMTGYNKMGANTFPNLMAVLTGYNETDSANRCYESENVGLDRCPKIWNTFQEHGYVTSYGEDVIGPGTTKIIRERFKNKSVDYYLRPLLDQDLTISEHIRYFCKAVFQVFDYALELDARYRYYSYFALLWVNYCHDDHNEPTALDEGMLEYMVKLKTKGVLDRSVVIFFSDHGARWGGLRQTMTGFFEERTPFLFIQLPSWLRESHPELSYALRVNTNRLTSPYDLHMTLKHILQLTGRIQNFSAAEGCPKCQSLLKLVPKERSCADAGIPERWCTCIESWSSVNKHSYKIVKMARFSVDKLNEVLTQYKNGELLKMCSLHSLKRVVSAFKIVSTSYIVSDEPNETYLILFQTFPNKAKFEALIRYFNVSKRAEEIYTNRVGSYAGDSKCINDVFGKNYCSCKKK